MTLLLPELSRTWEAFLSLRLDSKAFPISQKGLTIKSFTSDPFDYVPNYTIGGSAGEILAEKVTKEILLAALGFLVRADRRPCCKSPLSGLEKEDQLKGRTRCRTESCSVEKKSDIKQKPGKEMGFPVRAWHGLLKDRLLHIQIPYSSSQTP